ncbi:RimK family alpha-L-glutamate ligase [Halonotius terrestris]|uniref:RimK family alpha-L-glutamate ligase n=1 Tax=Halonotius terrestris TaxID=2487750 RepID=A0A8J8TBU5_9EURY|nr:RimK family alpha-L-glutamate ligase [Halonotius terrestris]TQQ81322.1 RimK family alpha-L-glutamate ligase [Halonotius terrestris]
MLRLAVTTNAETFDRIAEPLADRGIEVEHLQAKERAIQLTDPDAPPEFDVGLVSPGRLMEGAAVTARLDIPWVNGRDAVLTSRNKSGVLAALDAAGIPVPESVMISNPVDESVVVDAVADLSFPVVVKPNSATRGVGVAKASDTDSLLGIVDYLDLIHDFRATGDKSYVIQEFLPDARDYRAMVIDGDCVGGVERRLPDGLAEGRWKHNVHRGAEATGVDLHDSHRRLAERAAAELDIPYLGVDLLETADRLVVNETNARPTVDTAEKYDADFYDRLAGLIRETADTE